MPRQYPIDGPSLGVRLGGCGSTTAGVRAAAGRVDPRSPPTASALGVCRAVRHAFSERTARIVERPTDHDQQGKARQAASPPTTGPDCSSSTRTMRANPICATASTTCPTASTRCRPRQPRWTPDFEPACRSGQMSGIADIHRVRKAHSLCLVESADVRLSHDRRDMRNVQPDPCRPSLCL